MRALSLAMWLLLLACYSCLSMAVAMEPSSREKRSDTAQPPEPVTTEDKRDQLLATLAKQVMLQQLYIEEKIRSDGSSGIKQMRLNRDGPRPYNAAHHSARAIAAIHEHANNIRTIGMGEIDAVLNGLDFRTRHNDYGMRMPTNTTDYHKTDDIPFPDVPPEVLELGDNVSAQIEEMREWFKAWRDQNTTDRDYRPYFKANLCYLEGAWTLAGDKLEESFESDRHFVDAQTWQELQEKIRFTSYTGRKSADENFAYLPTTIIGFVDDLTPVFAQWNYRILCAPLKDDLPTAHLRLVDDLAPRFNHHWTLDAYRNSRAARFQVDDTEEGEKQQMFSLLDRLMAQVPGKDNYGAFIEDNALDEVAVTLNPDDEKDETLNAAFYHRQYKVFKTGAMGLVERRRGYSDRNMFVALTTQPKVAPVNLTECKGRKKNPICTTTSQRVSYAIPMEIIYTTPLSNWNPYGIIYKGDASTDEGKTVNAFNADGDRRIGQATKERAFNGTNSKLYYRTPVEFFTQGAVNTDAADTTRNSVGVLDKDDEVRRVRASGHRIFMPEIAGVGTLRQRYPIMPVHGEGSQVWKELAALQDAVMEMETYLPLFRQLPLGIKPTEEPKAKIFFITGESTSPGVSPHQHTFWLYKDEADALRADNTLEASVTTSIEIQHLHNLKLKYDGKKFIITYCEDEEVTQYACWDQHPQKISKDTTST